MDIKKSIRIFKDFPIKGVSFKDSASLVADKDALKYITDEIYDILKDEKIDYLVAPEARGFIFCASVAYKLGCGIILARKEGKLPGEVLKADYTCEYGTGTFEIPKGFVKKGDRLALIDDLIATGGTAKVIADTLEKEGGKMVKMIFIMELLDFKGRETLKGYDVVSLVEYDR